VNECCFLHGSCVSAVVVHDTPAGLVDNSVYVCVCHVRVRRKQTVVENRLEIESEKRIAALADDNTKVVDAKKVREIIPINSVPVVPIDLRHVSV